MTVPDKCKECNHAIVQLEQVHDGWCKYHMDAVVRCDCFPAQYPVGCASAEQYCKRKETKEGKIKE